MITINLNTVVKFGLTTTGREMLERHFRNLRVAPPAMAVEYRMLLWEVAHIFGAGMYMGVGESPIVRMEVRIDS